MAKLTGRQVIEMHEAQIRIAAHARSMPRYQYGCGPAAKFAMAIRGLCGSYWPLAEMERRDLVPGARVEYGTPEYMPRIKLGLPLSPPPIRAGEWAYNSVAGHNARVVSVSWDRPLGFRGGWRVGFYGYSTLDYVSGPLASADYVAYGTSDNGRSGWAIYPAMTAEIATRAA